MSTGEFFIPEVTLNYYIIHVDLKIGPVSVTETPYSKADLEDDRACKGLRADLKLCLLQSDCCKVERLTPRQCLKEGKAPDACVTLHHSFMRCKMSMVDNRSRMRGKKGS